MRSSAVLGSIRGRLCASTHTPPRILIGVARSASTMGQQLDGPSEVTNFISDLNNKYEKVRQQCNAAAAAVVCGAPWVYAPS
jgi:hypothetical protein